MTRKEQGASVDSRPFGHLPDGRSVESWTLTGAGGLVLEVITYGGIVRRLLAPDRSGQLADVVLGFDTLKAYLAGHPFFGAIAGRVAGRITNAKFELDGQRYCLAANDKGNHLHGGEAGFDKRVWTALPVARADGAPSLKLSYESADGEEGYPGRLTVRVTYTVTSDNGFQIDTEAVADRATPCNLTHHSYFNLAGEGAGTILDHHLQICSDEYVTNDENMALTGIRAPVVPSANNLNQPRPLYEAVPRLFQQHGDLYYIRRSQVEQNQRSLVTAARLEHPASGRVLTVRTTEDYLQFYSGVSLDGSLIGKSGQRYHPHAGLCLECEGYPDGVNCPALGGIILRPGQTSRQTTVYSFTAD